jgi:hypothetical protein
LSPLCSSPSFSRSSQPQASVRTDRIHRDYGCRTTFMFRHQDRVTEPAAFRPILKPRLAVGSSTGAVARRLLLGCIRGFPLRARLGMAVTPFPAPAASHVACGFPALRAPAHFTSRVMKPISLERLQSLTAADTRYSGPSVPYSHSLFHRFQPKPGRFDVQTVSLRLDVESSSQVLQTDGCLCHLTPASFLIRLVCSKAPLLGGRYPASSLLRA